MTSHDWEYSIIWEKHGHQLLLDHEHLIQEISQGRILLEIGSDRGEGSTEALARMARRNKMLFITVDMDQDISVRARDIVKSIDPTFEAFCARGEEFVLTLQDESVAVAYLDAYDTMPPDRILPENMAVPYVRNMGGWNNEAAWEMHLRTCQGLKLKMIREGLLCFDDVWRRGGMWAQRSKGYTAVPWLFSEGYREMAYVEGSILLLFPGV